MQSKATNVEQYLSELPADRKSQIGLMRELILQYLDPGFEEVMQYGMIGYVVPHRIFPAGYHCDPTQPLPCICLASQKNYMSLYMMSLYIGTDFGAWFEKAWDKTGKKRDMGKSCIRFKRIEDLPLEVIGEAVRRVTVKDYVALYQAIMQSRESQKSQPKSLATNESNRRSPTQRKSDAQRESVPSKSKMRSNQEQQVERISKLKGELGSKPASIPLNQGVQSSKAVKSSVGKTGSSSSKRASGSKAPRGK